LAEEYTVQRFRLIYKILALTIYVADVFNFPTDILKNILLHLIIDLIANPELSFKSSYLKHLIKVKILITKIYIYQTFQVLFPH